jgi:hypothetical protein
MVTIEEIGQLLDEKLSPLREEVARLSPLREDVARLSGDVELLLPLREDVARMSGNVTALTGDVARLTRSSGILVEASMRKEAIEMFGASFSKRFSIRSLYDAVHLLTKAEFGGLTPSADHERKDAANKLADKAKTLAIPLAQAFLESFTSNYGELVNPVAIESAKTAYENRDFNKGLGTLVGLAQAMDSIPKNVVRFMERLKKAFSTDIGDGADPVIGKELLTCDGPGVMLIELASRCDAARLPMETNFFQRVQESIEFDMRGTILLVGTHATVTCGEAKSSLAGLRKAKEQVRTRTRFLKTVVSTVFLSNFKTFVEVGHIFVPRQSAEERTQLPDDSIIDGVSIYIHWV